MAGRVTLITGCSTGIGKAIAARLAQDPAKRYVVYATMRNLKKSEELKKEAGEHLDKTLFIRELDVQKTDSVKSAVRQVIDEQGRIDAVVNNAGISGFNAIEYIPYEDIAEITDINLMGVIRMVKEVLPHMKRQRGGYIVNVSSLAGLLGYPFYEIYCASKSGLEGFTDALASRLQEFNIRICSLNAGTVTSEINQNILDGGRRTDLEAADDVTKRQLKMLTGYMKFLFEVAQTSEEMAECVQKILETEHPPRFNGTRGYFERNTARRYSDSTGMEWVNNRKRTLEMSEEDVD